MDIVADIADMARADDAHRFPRASDFDALDAQCDAVAVFKPVTKPAAWRLRLLARRFDLSRLCAQLPALALLVMLVHELRQFLDKQRRKTNVVRLATARYMLQDVKALHGYIDQIALALDTVYEDESLSPTGWRASFEAGRDAVLDRLDELAGDAVHLVRTLDDDGILSGLIVLKYEMDAEDHSNSPRELLIVQKASKTIIRQSKVKVPRLPAWFVPPEVVADRQDVVVYNFNSISTIGDERRQPGPDKSWNRQAQVVIRNIEADPGSFEQNAFELATNTWLQLDHDHVVRLCGGCHFDNSATSPFVVYEDAITASFVTYFLDDGDSSRHRRRKRFWRLFLQVARGVQYLHGQGIKHGDLKCSNLVVSVDGTAKVCDFVERASTRRHRMMENSVRWKAPECVISNGPDPSFEADTFALGLCLIEAYVGELPYGMRSDDDIESLFRAGNTHERPENLPDSVWSAVELLCAFNPADRPSIDTVVALFSDLADQEQREEEDEEEKAARAVTASTDSTDDSTLEA